MPNGAPDTVAVQRPNRRLEELEHLRVRHVAVLGALALDDLQRIGELQGAPGGIPPPPPPGRCRRRWRLEHGRRRPVGRDLAVSPLHAPVMRQAVVQIAIHRPLRDAAPATTPVAAIWVNAWSLATTKK